MALSSMVMPWESPFTGCDPTRMKPPGTPRLGRALMLIGSAAHGVPLILAVKPEPLPPLSPPPQPSTVRARSATNEIRTFMDPLLGGIPPPAQGGQGRTRNSTPITTNRAPAARLIQTGGTARV